MNATERIQHYGKELPQEVSIIPKKGQFKVWAEDDLPKNPLSDPNQMENMMEQMKKSMVQMVPQTLIMGWINYFFTGFVLSEYILLCSLSLQF